MIECTRENEGLRLDGCRGNAFVQEGGLQGANALGTGRYEGSFGSAVAELAERGLISPEAVSSIVDRTDTYGFARFADDGSREYGYTKSAVEAQGYRDSGWSEFDGRSYGKGNAIEIMYSARNPGLSADLGRGTSLRLSGYQNLIETTHHENLHWLGVESHTTDPFAWGHRMRTDIGGWIGDQ